MAEIYMRGRKLNLLEKSILQERSEIKFCGKIGIFIYSHNKSIKLRFKGWFMFQLVDVSNIQAGNRVC